MLRRPKRPDLLVEIASRTPETRYIVCGGPSSHRSPADYSQTIVESLGGRGNIDYLGRVDHSTTTEIIGHAGLLLSTSEAEGFPNVFLEAWASGTPVVSLSIDPDDLIRRFELGRVSGDVTGAVRDVRELMTSVEFRQRMGDRGRDYVKTNHCDAAVVRAFERALESPAYVAA